MTGKVDDRAARPAQRLHAAATSPDDNEAVRAVTTGSRADWVSVAMLGLAVTAATLAFLWPLFVVPSATLDGSSQSPFVFAALLPIVIGVVVSQLTRGSIDVKALAMLGVLAALGAIARPLGAGTAGIEFVFVPIILGGRVFGPAFGFLLGSTTLFTSGLLTGGIGPWMPYQMLAASFVGLGAGLLPRVRGWWEIAVLCCYSFVAAFAYGILVDLSFWPFNLGLGTEVSYVAGAPLLENLHRFLVFNLATSMGWNLGRAVTTIVTLVLVGRPMLRILRRTNRRAHYAEAPA